MAGTDNAMPYSLSLEQLIFTPQDITDPAFPRGPSVCRLAEPDHQQFRD